MFLKDLAGILLFAGTSALMLLLVPWNRIKELLTIGLVGGLGVALLLVYIMQNLTGFWRFNQVDFFSLWRIPIFLSAAWIPLEIIYSHFLAQYKSPSLMAGLILAVPLGAAFIHYLLLLNKMIFYHRWNLFLTFLISLGIHLSIGFYLYLTGRIENLKLI